MGCGTPTPLRPTLLIAGPLLANYDRPRQQCYLSSCWQWDGNLCQHRWHNYCVGTLKRQGTGPVPVASPMPLPALREDVSARMN
jgi:hypothetical protein